MKLKIKGFIIDNSIWGLASIGLVLFGSFYKILEGSSIFIMNGFGEGLVELGIVLMFCWIPLIYIFYQANLKESK